MAPRLLVTSDLHYNIPRSRRPTEALADRACRMGGDALVLVGDTAAAEPGPLRACLRLFARFGGRKFLVPGNHCLWCRPGEDSLDRLERVLPAIAAEEGFHLLDGRPARLDGVALVGSVGWYDYAFRDERLGIPEAFYRAKVSPGAAAWLGGYEPLLAAHAARLPRAALDLRTRWMDGVHVRLGMSDEEFLDRVVGRLAEDLRAAAAGSERILAFVHHLPFAELLPRNRPRNRAFGSAFLGSPRLGAVLEACPEVTDVYCGHSHWPAEARVGLLRAVAVGSTYTHKELKVVDIDVKERT